MPRVGGLNSFLNKLDGAGVAVVPRSLDVDLRGVTCIQKDRLSKLLFITRTTGQIDSHCLLTAFNWLSLGLELGDKLSACYTSLRAGREIVFKEEVIALLEQMYEHIKEGGTIGSSYTYRDYERWNDA